MKTKYTVDYFINKFQAIPEKQWITGNFDDDTGDAHCVLGHCGVHWGASGLLEIYTSESMALVTVFKSLAQVSSGFDIALINDGRIGAFEQSTPKQRILAALLQIKEQQP